jgi:adenylyltransferase/sulfurtransferase
MLYDEEDAAGHLPKAAAAAEKLRRINSSVEVEAHIADMTWRNTEELLGDVDLILDGTDNFQTRYLINDASLKLGIPWIYGGAVGSRGMAFTILPGRTACLRCLFPHPPAPGTAETCDTAGVIGPIIHVVAAHQAVEALKWLVGAEDAMERRLRYFELWHNRDLAFDVADRKNPDCPTCAHKRFEFLEPADKSIHEISLCGRESVQISPANEFRPDLDRLEALLKPLGKVERNPFLLRAEIGKHRLVLFPDGRILVQGTTDIPEARSLVAKYIGL